jgi:hypothetical protein
MGSVPFSIKNQLSPNNAHVSKLSGSSNPELHGFFVGHAHDKLFGFFVVDGLSFKVFHITSMSKFGQPKTPNVFKGECAVPKVLMNLTIFSAKVVDSLSVKENGDVTFDTKARVKIVGDMGSDGQ